MKNKLLFLCWSISLAAQSVNLSSIDVQESSMNLYECALISITEEKTKKRRDITMSEKLSSDISFSLTTNYKGESAVSFRGLDYKNTRFFEDGIPLYSTNTGIDTNMMMQRGEVYFNDGSSPSSTGISSMGGEVIISRRIPKKNFESSFLGSTSTNDQLYSIYAGSMQEDYYIQADASYFHRNSFTLSDDFEETSVEDKGERTNSDKEQKNISLKAGLFVTDTLHLAAKLSFSQAKYGIEPNTLGDITSPVWNAYTRIDPKELGSLSLYLDYDADEYQLRFRTYYDEYTDIYEIYNDLNYTASSPLVTYNDARIGSSLKITREIGSHTTNLAFILEENEHKRLGGGLDDITSSVANFNAALGDIWNFNKYFSTEFGISYAYMQAIDLSEDSQATPPNDKKSLDGQIKLNYTYLRSKTYISVAKKSRMPLMSEMFTYFPLDISNPNLIPEESLQYSAGYKQNVSFATNISMDIFYYDIKNLIVSNGNNSFINRDTSINYGGELRVTNNSFEANNLNFSYAYTNTKDSDANALELIPKHKLRFEDSISFSKQYQAFVAYSFISSRYSQNSATYTDELEKLDAYHLLDAQFRYVANENFDLRVGIKNLLDADYERAYGYPTQGRSLYLSLEIKI